MKHLLLLVFMAMGFMEGTADAPRKYLIYLENDVATFPDTVEEFRYKYEVYRLMAMLTNLLLQHPVLQKKAVEEQINWTLVIPTWSIGRDEKQPDALDDILDDDAMELFVPHEDYKDWLDDYRKEHGLKGADPITVSMALMSSESGCPTPDADGMRSGFGDLHAIRAAKCLKLPTNDVEDAYTRAHMLFEIISLSNLPSSLLIDSTTLPRPGMAVPSYDEPLYWRQRRSLRPSDTLRKIANAFRNKALASDDILDGTLRPGDWRGHLPREEPPGGAYLSTWVDHTTDMSHLADHLSHILEARKLTRVYMAGDVGRDAATDLQAALQGAATVVQFDEAEIADEPQMKKTLRKPRPTDDVSLHLIDAWIAAHAREFVGRPCSPDTQLVAEERAILGFAPNDSSIFPYTDEEENCPTLSIQMLELIHDDSDETAKIEFDERMEQKREERRKKQPAALEREYRKLARKSANRRLKDIMKATEELEAMGQVLGMPTKTTVDLEAIADVLAEAKRTATKKKKRNEKRVKKEKKALNTPKGSPKDSPKDSPKASPKDEL